MLFIKYINLFIKQFHLNYVTNYFHIDVIYLYIGVCLLGVNNKFFSLKINRPLWRSLKRKLNYLKLLSF